MLLCTLIEYLLPIYKDNFQEDMRATSQNPHKMLPGYVRYLLVFELPLISAIKIFDYALVLKTMFGVLFIKM